MKVDLYDNMLNLWLPGIVLQIDQLSKIDCKISVMKEGYSSDFNEKVGWPNPLKVDYCGSKLIDRICDSYSLQEKKSTDFNLKICFSAKTECPAG
mgnify:CR=1 FL=1